MRVLTGLVHPDGGAIEMLGRPFNRRDRHRLFDVGALVEIAGLLPVPVGPGQPAVPSRPAAPRCPLVVIDEVLEVVGLRERGGDKVSRYSLGMKQRLGIAGALLNDPKLLLLDEPSNGLDPAGIVAMRDMLRHLAVDRQDRVHLEPPAGRGAADGRRGRDHRRRTPRARRLDAGAAGRRGHRPRSRRSPRRSPAAAATLGRLTTPERVAGIGRRGRLDLGADHARSIGRGQPHAGRARASTRPS